jgi:lysophospholipase L1-like esterase
MANLENFVASVEVPSGLKPMGNNTFPIAQAHDILAGYDEDGNEIRLDDKIDGIQSTHWYSGTGTLSNGQLIGVTLTAKLGDMYLNTDTGDVYRCTKGGSWVDARWETICNIKGTNGKSAYEYAKANGYTGTEEEFYEDINPDSINENAKDFITEELAKRGQLKPEFANSVADLEASGDTTKVYVLPDGEIYGYIRKEGTPPEITIESRNDGYWSVGSALDISFQTIGGISAKKTNKIPVTPGDQLSYKGQMKYSTNKSVVWSNASGTPISGEQIQSLNSAKIVTAPANAAFAEFLSFNESATVPATLVVEWVLCQSAAPTYRWASMGIRFVASGLEDEIENLKNDVNELKTGVTSVLKGKKIVYDGDSICQGYNAGGGYATIIANKVGGTYVNQSVGGAYLRSTTVSGKHSVVDNLANLPKDGDLYCFEGGINDYWNNATLGTFSKTDFTGTLDKTTVCGALETIFRYALTNFVGKPICFVITHKIQSTAYNKNNSNGNTFEEYRNAMVGICQKYSIPYYDAFSESGLNGWNTVQNNTYLTANANGTADGTHPNVEGYKRYYVPQLIALFEKIMPV